MGTRRLILCFLAACAGPSVSIDDVAVAPSPVAGHVRVTATLHNAGGHGNVELHVTLRGATRIEWDGSTEVDGTQSRLLVLDVPAPPGTYTAQLATKYPH